MASQLFFTTASGSITLGGSRGGNQHTTWSIRDARLNWAKEYSLTLTSVVLPNSVYPINRFNNKIYVNFNGGAVQTLTIPVGLYAPDSFATAIHTVLDTVDASFNCTHSAVTYRVTVSVTGTFKFYTGANSAYETMGFSSTGVYDPFVDFSSQTDSPFVKAVATFTGTSPMNIGGSQYIDICSNLATNNWSASSTNNILARIPLTSGFGTLVVYEPSIPQEVLVSAQSNVQLEIYLLDDKGNEFQLPDNSPMSLTFKIEILK